MLRRSRIAFLVGVCVLAASFALPGGAHAASPSRLALPGLRFVPGGPCGSLYQMDSRIDGRVECTHGPDPVPQGVIGGHNPSIAEIRARAAHPTAAIPCPNPADGTSGPRVQAIYAVASDQPD